MNDLGKVSYIAERDIDLLLLEEFNVNPDLPAWLLERTSAEPVECADCIGAWHSVTHSKFGESDLVVLYRNGLAVLIENKIDAPAQPEQAARYKGRGEEGLSSGQWRSYITCIVAPERYLRGNAEAQNYDVRVSYEQIRDWFNAQGSTRCLYRAYIMEEAIEQNRRGYSPAIDDSVTQFWQSYWEVANTEFPSLEMPLPNAKPANSDWPYFRPTVLGGELRIVHKMAQGCVDLQIQGAAEKLAEIKSYLNESDMEVVAAGKSAAIRLRVSEVDRFGPFGTQREKVLQALKAAQRLRGVGEQLKDNI